MLVVFSSHLCVLWDWKAPSKKPLEKQLMEDPESVSSYNHAALSCALFTIEYIALDMHGIEMHVYIQI